MLMANTKMTTLVNAKSVVQLIKEQAQKSVLLDATWYLPTESNDGKREFFQNRLPGARFFGIDEAKDHRIALPHMLPPTEEFAAYVGNLGIDRNTNVIIYDRKGFFSSPRVYWTFKVFGHKNVFLFPNAFADWKANGHGLETENPSTPAKVNYEDAKINKSLVASFEDISQVLKDPSKSNTRIIDARPQARFTGTAPEIRPGMASGHIPTSINIPFTDLVKPGITEPKPTEELEEIFAKHGLHDKSAPIITSCGSGVTASVLFVALELCGFTNVRVYDESWSGYGQRALKDSSLLATGP
ncbi:mitochondrial thiosulfate sulfurtransferase, involved in tRNA wobble position thiolation Tum1 [Schizosaccharomyces osmophilus]|uniref:Mitochondrial thiosulfate sulfurtransferase, involved in tRNA wobble position thiolation Tum1 n=1 Tax=Schizosaccharomyces osmophilus TaxID=2545709 RepID=A0AAE9WEG5_9SCHI|nr:mitochondrial thiosulfate sulfurtransferase, involved in tRNA wobble position thiolation Tum1 [Schizosaccharomyces osmophilus]WBW74891.1 mitochondrial thiosulfate sulfurtransferase, involved in tRNA wobble position thiolation Tum1 [Schizosaccharomyces osmophilus]